MSLNKMSISPQTLTSFVKNMRRLGLVDKFIDMETFDPSRSTTIGYVKPPVNNPFSTEVFGRQSVYRLRRNASPTPVAPDNLYPIVFTDENWTDSYLALDGVDTIDDLLDKHLWRASRKTPLPSSFQNKFSIVDGANRYIVYLSKVDKSSSAPALPTRVDLLGTWTKYYLTPSFDPATEDVWSTIYDGVSDVFGSAHKVDFDSLWSVEYMTTTLKNSIHECIGLRGGSTRFADPSNRQPVLANRETFTNDYNFVYVNTARAGGYIPKIGNRIKFLTEGGNLEQVFNNETFHIYNFKEQGNVKIVQARLHR